MKLELSFDALQKAEDEAKAALEKAASVDSSNPLQGATVESDAETAGRLARLKKSEVKEDRFTLPEKDLEEALQHPDLLVTPRKRDPIFSDHNVAPNQYAADHAQLIQRGIAPTPLSTTSAAEEFRTPSMAGWKSKDNLIEDAWRRAKVAAEKPSGFIKETSTTTAESILQDQRAKVESSIADLQQAVDEARGKLILLDLDARKLREEIAESTVMSDKLARQKLLGQIQLEIGDLQSEIPILEQRQQKKKAELLTLQ